jgi:Ca2+-transporting ATPase
MHQVKGVADALKTNTEKGIYGDDADLLKRKNAFGSNTYPQKKGRSFWVTSFANLYSSAIA